jgi:lambda repressor-like predicted transcriptional regulator
VDWKKIKAEYIAGGTSYRKLAKKHKVSYNTLAKVAAKENWGSLKQETAEKITTKIVEIESDKQADRMKRLLTVSDKLLTAVEDAVDKFQAKELLLDRAALKSLSGTIKDIKDIQSIKTELDIEEQKARIAILRKQAEADANGSTEVSITFGVDEEQNRWAE